MEHETAGDPVSGLKWTRRTTAKVADELCALGIDVCPQTVARLLKAMGYSLRPPASRSAVQQTARRALLGRSGPRSVAIGGRAEGLDIQGDAVGAELRLRFRQRAEHGDRAACIGGQLRRAPVVDAQHHQGGVESRPPLRPTGVSWNSGCIARFSA